MPGKGHIPDPWERILRGLKANTNRTAGGLGSNASPGMTRDRVAAMRRGAPASGTTSARSSKVDTFSIADDSDSSFTLTHAPIVDSWNLELNGVRVHGSEFSISGRTLSIVDAADLFLGADTQGSPWDLEIQYDYLTGTPGAPDTGAVLFKDPLVTSPASSGLWTAAAGSYFAGAGRADTTSQQMQSDSHMRKTFASIYKTLTVGIALRSGAGFNDDGDSDDYGLASFCGSGGAGVHIYFGFDGANKIRAYRGQRGTLLATATTALTVSGSTWNYVTMTVTVDDSAGSISVVQNGVEVLTYSGDTRNSSDDGSDTIRIGGFWPLNLTADDIYINDVNLGDAGDVDLLELK